MMRLVGEAGPGGWQGRNHREVRPEGRHVRTQSIKDQGSKTRIEDQGQGSRIKDPGSRIKEQGSRIKDQGSRIMDQGSRVKDQGSRIQDPGSRIKDLEKSFPGTAGVGLLNVKKTKRSF